MSVPGLRDLPGRVALAPVPAAGQDGWVTGMNLVQEAVAELYSAAPHEFISQRGELVARARAAGEPAAAKQIGALRKPTQSAWIVNQLARSVPAAAQQLAELGAELRKAQRSLDGEAIRELSHRRRELIDDLTRQAFTVTGQRSPPAALRDEVATTLAAALADPGIADELASGAMERAARSDGFGPATPVLTLVTSPPGGPAEGGPAPGGSRPGGSALAGARGAGSVRRPASAAGRHAPAGSPAPARPPTPAGRSARAGGPDTLRPPATAAAAAKEQRRRQRQAVSEAKAAAAAADKAAGAATRAEQDLERSVQRLAEELADARQELARIRGQARRARARQSQARQALERLQRGRGR